MPVPSVRMWVATVAALLGFAGNSLLCRAALATGTIDPWSFTGVRICGGALALGLIVRFSGRTSRGAGSRGSALALWGYAAAFSLAYVRLHTGVGALILFASVQATMIGWSVVEGSRPSSGEMGGFALALIGLVVLTRPGADLPDPQGMLLMSMAGIAWGAYSLRGRGSRQPLLTTCDNFVRGVPLALVGSLAAVILAAAHASTEGILLALASGALASGLGYSLWYLALPELGAVRAAIVQLVVPVVAAGAGIAFLGEQPSLRLWIAGPLILGGVGLALSSRGRR